MSFDARTLAFVIGCVSAVVMAIMVYIRLTHKVYAGFTEWTWTFILSAIVAVLLGLRGSIPELLSVVVMNTLYAGGYVLLVNGLRKFHNQPPVRANLVLLVIMTLGVLYTVYIDVDISLRAFIIASMVGVITLRAAIDLFMLTRKDSRTGTRLVITALIALTCNQVIRALAAAHSNTEGDFFDPGVVSATETNLFLILSLLSIVILVCSLILLVSERLTLELHSAQTELHLLAQTDALTGVSNLRHFSQEGDAALLLARANNAPLALIVLDIDFFKEINDTYGHHAGDAVLKLTAHACKSALRKSDLLARVGGDEFFVLLPDTDDATSAQVLSRISDSVARLDLTSVGVANRLTISGGWATLSADDASLAALIRRADAGMYREKAVRHQADHAHRTSLQVSA